MAEHSFDLLKGNGYRVLIAAVTVISRNKTADWSVLTTRLSPCTSSDLEVSCFE